MGAERYLPSTEVLFEGVWVPTTVISAPAREYCSETARRVDTTPGIFSESTSISAWYVL